MLKLHHFRDFVAIAEARTIRGAARSVGLAQPAMSRSMRELEKELDVTLLKRNSTGIALTPAGDRFLIRARAALNEIQRGFDEMAAWGNAAGGTVAVALSNAPLLGLLPTVWEQYRAKNPKVKLHFTESTFPAAEFLLRDGRIDFYIGARPEGNISRSYEVKIVFHNSRKVFARRAHPLINVTKLAELQEAEWLYSGLRQPAELDLEEFFQKNQLPCPSRTTRVDSSLGLLLLIASTDAIALLPKQVEQVRGLDGLIHAIDVVENLKAPDIVLIRRAELPLTPAAEALANLFFREGTHMGKI